MEPRGCNRSQHRRGERQDPKKPHRYAVRPARRSSRKRVLHTCHAGGPFKQLRTSALGACQFPSVLTDTKGEIRKPGRW